MANPPDQVVIDPVGNNVHSVTPIAPPLEAAPRLSDVLRAGLVTGITASLVCWLFYGIGSLFGTEFDVQPVWSSNQLHFAWYLAVLLPLVAVMLYALAVSALRDRAGCRSLCLIIGYALGLLAVAACLVQPDAVTWPTRIWLALGALVMTLLSVPQIARVVGDSDPRVTAGHRRLGLDAAA